ncbi:InlB B-repeat-containing protein, partial [Peptoniphilus rhinitidis]|uniref:InlB B-repeat-containing protein n=1 Tax=Peptoniphilus rhinitidis TaxID=1175452 RepID=UPI0029028872
MNNKKLLSLAIAGVMITAMPFNVFAGENEGALEDKTTVGGSARESATGEENSSVQDTEKVTVTFDSDGGSEVAVQTIEKGKTAKAPAAPTKEGKEFVEWQKDG